MFFLRLVQLFAIKMRVRDISTGDFNISTHNGMVDTISIAVGYFKYLAMEFP